MARLVNGGKGDREQCEGEKSVCVRESRESEREREQCVRERGMRACTYKGTKQSHINIYTPHPHPPTPKKIVKSP